MLLKHSGIIVCCCNACQYGVACQLPWAAQQTTVAMLLLAIYHSKVQLHFTTVNAIVIMAQQHFTVCNFHSLKRIEIATH